MSEHDDESIRITPAGIAGSMTGVAIRSVRPAGGFPRAAVLSYVRIVSTPRHPTELLSEEFLRNRPVLARYLRARGAGDAAEDLLQELWLKIASLPGDLEVLDPASYLYRMAHNLMLDRRRTEQRRTARDRHYHETSEADGIGIDPAPAADRTLMARQALAQIDHVLSGLGQRTDHIFRRHRVEGVPQREIAAELGITLSAVEKHLQKAYRAVHGAYRQMEQAPKDEGIADGAR